MADDGRIPGAQARAPSVGVDQEIHQRLAQGEVGFGRGFARVIKAEHVPDFVRHDFLERGQIREHRLGVLHDQRAGGNVVEFIGSHASAGACHWELGIDEIHISPAAQHLRVSDDIVQIVQLHAHPAIARVDGRRCHPEIGQPRELELQRRDVGPDLERVAQRVERLGLGDARGQGLGIDKIFDRLAAIRPEKTRRVAAGCQHSGDRCRFDRRRSHAWRGLRSGIDPRAGGLGHQRPHGRQRHCVGRREGGRHTGRDPCAARAGRGAPQAARPGGTALGI